MGDTTTALEELIEQVRGLELRIHALEAQLPGAPAPQPAIRATVPASSSGISAGLIPVLGQAVLGIAGAFLLRAAAESGKFPWTMAVTAGLAWAAFWLVHSVTKALDKPVVRGIYSATAALIFFPMLWETTVEFKVLPPVGSAGLLVAFVLLGSSLAWFRGMAPSFWVASAAAAIAICLTVATGEVTPFCLAILAIASMVEILRVQGQGAGMRAWVALIADASVGFAIYIAGASQALGDYKPAGHAAAAGMCVVLLGVYGCSTGFRAGWLKRRITYVGAAQLAVAFSLAYWGWLTLNYSAVGLGAFSLALSGLLYWSANVSMGRNRYVFSSLGLALLLVGTVLMLPEPVAAMLWALVAVAAMFNSALALHGALLLAAGAALSGLLEYTRAAMLSPAPPGAPSIALCVVAVAAAVCWVVCSSGPAAKWLRLVAGSLAVSAAAASLVVTIGVSSSAWLPTVRTVIVCSGALLLAVCGSRFGRIELVWIAYGAVAMVTFKLFLEDFRQCPPEALAVSLVCYGAVLIFGTRLISAASVRSE